MLIEGDDPAVASGEGFRLPVKGRIAIVVYVAVGEAVPKLEIEKTGWIQQNGQRVPRSSFATPATHMGVWPGS